MARWQPLPDALEPQLRELVLQMRRIKDRTGLSLAALGSRTPYSKSSWERYLNGRKLMPRQAVEALGALAGADRLRLVALWETAVYGRGAAPYATPDDAACGNAVFREDTGPPLCVSEAPPRTCTEHHESPEPGGDLGESRQTGADGSVDSAFAADFHDDFDDLTAPLIAERRSRQRRAVLAGAVATVVLGGGLASGYELLPVGHHTPAAAVPASAAAAPGAGALPALPCHDKVQDGRHYAGYAQTSTDVVGEGAAGPQVTEIQCMLARQHMGVGSVDGHFGRITETAVKAFQSAHRLPADGVVGKDTWTWLRA